MKDEQVSILVINPYKYKITCNNCKASEVVDDDQLLILISVGDLIPIECECEEEDNK